MNWLDITVIAVLGINILISLKRGLVKELFTLLGIILGLIFASRFYQDVTLFENLLKNPVLGKAISFLLIFLGVAIALNVLGIFLHKLIKLGGMGMLNYLGGFIFGFLKGAMIIGMVLFFLSRFPPAEKLIENSPVALVILRLVSSVFHLIWRPEEVTEYI